MGWLELPSGGKSTKSWLENPLDGSELRFIAWKITDFYKCLWSIFQHAMFDYRSVGMVALFFFGESTDREDGWEQTNNFLYKTSSSNILLAAYLNPVLQGAHPLFIWTSSSYCQPIPKIHPLGVCHVAACMFMVVDNQIIWVNLITSSLRPHHRWWLVRWIIPKRPYFRLANYCNFHRIIHKCFRCCGVFHCSRKPHCPGFPRWWLGERLVNWIMISYKPIKENWFLSCA